MSNIVEMKIEYLTIFLLYFSNIYKKKTHSDTLADQNSFGVLIKSGRTSGLFSFLGILSPVNGSIYSLGVI